MRVYANLLGTWTDITEDGTVEFGNNPVTYFKDNLTLEEGSETFTCFKYGYVRVEYDDVSYRLHPSHIQITGF